MSDVGKEQVGGPDSHPDTIEMARAFGGVVVGDAILVMPQTGPIADNHAKLLLQNALDGRG